MQAKVFKYLNILHIKSTNNNNNYTKIQPKTKKGHSNEWPSIINVFESLLVVFELPQFAVEVSIFSWLVFSYIVQF